MPTRHELIHKAAALPVGDPERRRLLAALSVDPEFSSYREVKNGMEKLVHETESNLLAVAQTLSSDWSAYEGEAAPLAKLLATRRNVITALKEFNNVKAAWIGFARAMK